MAGSFDHDIEISGSKNNGGREFVDLLSYLYASDERVYFRELVISSSTASYTEDVTFMGVMEDYEEL